LTSAFYWIECLLRVANDPILRLPIEIDNLG
jgi:hypothetical protein